ncbi:unnamed protein product, partial [Mesorhabditis belari]|uniref:Uncharacterized protein n=1 Tax=Mesorhabditis belari TaxID=2138241 RepID=A0AAF3FFM1_9BILA
MDLPPQYPSAASFATASFTQPSSYAAQYTSHNDIPEPSSSASPPPGGSIIDARKGSWNLEPRSISPMDLARKEL